MFPWSLLIGGASSLLGGLLGGGGPKVDKSQYDQSQSWLDEIYKGSQNPLYENSLQQLLSYFQGGGSATDANRQKAYNQVLQPINRMIPDARTRIQNQQARMGILTPGTVAAKGESDLQSQAAFQRSQAMEGVNQRFDQTLDQNKGLAMSMAGNMTTFLKNLGMNAASTKGQLSLQQMPQQMQQNAMGTNWGQMLMGLGGSAMSQGLSSWFQPQQTGNPAGIIPQYGTNYRDWTGYSSLFPQPSK